jgi:hypothetical protein
MNPKGELLIIVVCWWHITLGAILIVDHLFVQGGADDVVSLWAFNGWNPLVTAAVLIGAALLGRYGLVCRSQWAILCAIPQQMLVLATLYARVHISMLETMPDGTSRPWTFILAAGLAGTVLGIGHTAAIISWYTSNGHRDWYRVLPSGYRSSDRDTATRVVVKQADGVAG